MMIKSVSHTVADTGPAGLGLALEVAYELHAPVTRAPEVAAPQMMGLRTSTAYSHRRKVPLSRISTMRA